jgi:2-oxoglutarate/2-oxoacid ferredoxin oxidoreductase subunit alpha
MSNASKPGTGAVNTSVTNGRGFVEVENVIIRFAGDSGDGMQVTGAMFSDNSAIAGHDISTLPDFPAEIRAPAGTLPGVSSFQLNFSSFDIHTPGDQPDVLVALNPAALKVNLKDLKPGGTLILNKDSFQELDMKKAGYTEDPREDGSLSAYQVYDLPITSVCLVAVENTGLTKRQAELTKNMFTLGIICWLFDRTLDLLERRIEKVFTGKKAALAEPNKLALNAGYNFADTIEAFSSRYTVSKIKLPPGEYRRITGNEATALGFLSASHLCNRPLFYASYPITPASDILHELSKLRHFGVKTVQAEDEISAIGMAIGAAYGGSLGLTGTSGPGIALKAEAVGLAVMAELPIVIIDVQRGGPSTGLPTKTEQSDLLQAIYGRNGECPVIVVAPGTPGECFDMAIEAFRLAIKYMTPVFFLSDGYLANGSEPWRIPDPDQITRFDVTFSTAENGFIPPYSREPDTQARPWIIPGTAGLEHQIGGLEKENISGKVSYDPENHELMCRLRASKVEGAVKSIPELKVHGDERGDLLVLGWGGTLGAIRQAVDKARSQGYHVSCAHLRYLNPFPGNTESVLRNFGQVLVPELNLGQLRLLIRAKYLVDAVALNKVQGQPFKTSEIEGKIHEMLDKPVRKVAGA